MKGIVVTSTEGIRGKAKTRLTLCSHGKTEKNNRADLEEADRRQRKRMEKCSNGLSLKNIFFKLYCLKGTVYEKH